MNMPNIFREYTVRVTGHNIEIAGKDTLFPAERPGMKKTYVCFLIQMTEMLKKLCEKTKKSLKKNELLCMIDISYG